VDRPVSWKFGGAAVAMSRFAETGIKASKVTVKSHLNGVSPTQELPNIASRAPLLPHALIASPNSDRATANVLCLYCYAKLNFARGRLYELPLPPKSGR
jgi:hypothetical protein